MTEPSAAEETMPTSFINEPKHWRDRAEEGASLSRPSGQWRDDDYDVLEDGVVVGRIFKVPVAPQDRAWMWAGGHSGHIKRAAYGYETTREAAMAAFAKSWRRE
jgi:hypothetical protein